ASARQVLECRAAHCAQAADGDVEMAHGAVPVAKLSYRCALAMRKRTLFASAGPVAVPVGPPNRVICSPIETGKHLSTPLFPLPFFCFATCGFSPAKPIPLPPPPAAGVGPTPPPPDGR